MRAAVVVGGDLARSPRMLYHAHALAAAGVDVDLIGYRGASLPQFITRDARIDAHRVGEARLRFRIRRSATLYALAASVDAVGTGIRLLVALARIAAPDLVLVQNPPTLPVLPVAWLAARWRGARLVVDWHNLGYTVVALRLGRRHIVVRLSRWVEMILGRAADAHLCVSRGLSRFLAERFRIRRAQVFYDRPAASFMPLEGTAREQTRQALFTRLAIRGGGPVGFVVCPTGWTEDEDFDLAIEAVQRLEERIRGWEALSAAARFPDLLILVTGDGRRRAEFERRFAGLPARRVQLRTRWLEPDEYPRIVGSADLGLCLHRSSSGLDIPMKVADMFGTSVPLCALDYGVCLAERVRHGENGVLYSSGRQLAEVLFDLFEKFPAEAALLERLRTGARRSARPSWEEGWAVEARPVLLPAPPAR